MQEEIIPNMTYINNTSPIGMEPTKICHKMPYINFSYMWQVITHTQKIIYVINM